MSTQNQFCYHMSAFNEVKLPDSNVWCNMLVNLLSAAHHSCFSWSWSLMITYRQAHASAT